MFLKKPTHPKSNISIAEKKAFKTLQSNNDMMIQKAGKEGKVVIINTRDQVKVCADHFRVKHFIKKHFIQ